MSETLTLTHDSLRQPEVIRHNSCFLVPRAPDGGAGWLPPSRPILGDYRYHDMVCETIYQKSSKDLDRAFQHMEAQKQREEERAEWSRERFRRQRETAELWQDMRETFSEIMKPQTAPVQEKAFNPWAPTAAEFNASNGISFGQRPLDEAQGRGKGLFNPAATVSGPLEKTTGKQLERSSSEPGGWKPGERWRPTPGRRPRGLMQGGPKQVVEWPGGWVPKQAPGNRGLPPGYLRASGSARGDMYW
eukprot:CAMPEP_0197623112 /NCGR_PEP_ID=MMETSP1338-20131121/3186_1 /TAXON_ID=43686 ORGANISM="Pelagodinium beii, Strain RCC1491" /NCGR_SAMPLE_ID=MMETSP1338 /ASSEMBLY_ACC=CAM_ASM_000754 /LENGTH=245 /DNA_ID=CAMNT_0043192977 /DNA_START=77 /DNA_END=811 /DNA_ORIENTATION=+